LGEGFKGFATQMNSFSQEFAKKLVKGILKKHIEKKNVKLVNY
jgi:hypothetical protein